MGCRRREMTSAFHSGRTIGGGQATLPCRHAVFVVLAVLACLALARPASAQVVYSGDSGGYSLSAGATASGYQVEGVKDGVEGLEELLTCDYDLVITDNTMPRMTGIQMIAKLYAARLSLPVIMATGQLPVHEFASRPWLTPDATLQRPFSNDDLLATVKKVLRADDSNVAHMGMLLPKYL